MAPSLFAADTALRSANNGFVLISAHGEEAYNSEFTV
jgi:hypothetical protein